MHTTIAAAAAADWQFEASLSEANCKRVVIISIFLACYHVAKQ